MTERQILMALVLVGMTGIARADYEEERVLTLESRGIDLVDIEAGAGALEVTGVPGAEAITVTARIRIDNDEDDARRAIERDMTLTLEKDSDVARLVAHFDSGMFGWSDSPHIDLKVEMPEGMHLQVDDGSGSIEISDLRGDIRIDDGSGSLVMNDVGGNIEIEDGSGSITIRSAGGDVAINDGSGSINVRGVAGSVTVDDGSGSIDVSDVDEDLIIVDDGSGGLDFSNIGGRVETDT
jgi:hypothetical protein